MSFVGGKLKLKGDAGLPGVKKKKKKDDTSKQVVVVSEEAGDGVGGKELSLIESKDTSSSIPPPSDISNAVGVDRRTEAEKRFEEHVLKFEEQRLKKAAQKSHRQRIKELNEKLSTLTEHHDIPRISYSYM